jgi:flagellar assembly factor FliW
MCEMVSYMVYGKKYVINANRGRLVPRSILDYLYLHPKTFVSVSEATRVRIHIRTKNMKISMVSVIPVRIRSDYTPTYGGQE